VEPTNNRVERSLRGPVIHRKLSHGTRTDDGERLIERALSASVSCRLQGRSLFRLGAWCSTGIAAHDDPRLRRVYAARRVTPPPPDFLFRGD
jgi:hypothetical protein